MKFLLLVALFLLPFFVQAQSTNGGGNISPLNLWVSTTTPDAYTQRTFGKPLKITGLTTGQCLTLASNGVATTTGAVCGSVGGATSTNPFMATYFVATSTTATSTIAGNLQVDGSLKVNGTLYISGTAYTSFTQGSALFAGSGGVLAQDNTNFFWDDSNNRLGIGTPTPQEKLSIVGSDPFIRLDNTSTGGYGLYSATADAYYGFSGSSNSVIAGSVAGDITLRTASKNILFSNSSGSSAQMKLSDNGRLGLGTTTPNSILHIASTTPKITLSDTSAGTNLKHWFMQSTGGAFRISTTSDALVDQTATPPFLIDSTGQVGIGVTAPFSVFHATRSTGAGMTLQRTTATGVTGDILGTLTAYNGSTRTSIFEMNSDGATDSGQMVFWNKATGGSITPNMTLKSSGLLGIGTQSPMTAIPFNNIYTGGGLEVRNSSSAAIAISSNVPDLYFNDMDGSVSQKSFGFRVNGGKVTQTLFSDAGGTLFSPMTYDMATGFVGISTTSPSMTLAIGAIGTATSTTYKASGENKGHCEIWADSDGSGVTYVTANNGVLTASTVPCN